MEVTVLNEHNSIFNVFLSEIRDVVIQQDPLRFRSNIERMGEVLAYEISKSLEYKSKSIQTPLGIANENLIQGQP
ncbi:MAG: uracil phosphoribosyltransferase, partial [Flavobacteriales bacterium]